MYVYLYVYINTSSAYYIYCMFGNESRIDAQQYIQCMLGYRTTNIGRRDMYCAYESWLALLMRMYYSTYMEE